MRCFGRYSILICQSPWLVRTCRLKSNITNSVRSRPSNVADIRGNSSIPQGECLLYRPWKPCSCSEYHQSELNHSACHYFYLTLICLKLDGLRWDLISAERCWYFLWVSKRSLNPTLLTYSRGGALCRVWRLGYFCCPSWLDSHIHK